jgi:hypothetical protein
MGCIPMRCGDVGLGLGGVAKFKAAGLAGRN